MTIYTKNGKPILKNVGGVYKLVTGDCCCGCGSDSRCGLTHTIIELNTVAHGTGGANSGAVIMSLWMEDPGGAVLGTTSQTNSYTYNAQSQQGSWSGFTPNHTGCNKTPVGVYGANCWTVSCVGRCSNATRDSRLLFSRTEPEIDVYNTGTIYIRVQDDAPVLQSGSYFDVTATVVRSHRTKVVYGNAEYVAGGTFSIRLLPNVSYSFLIEGV